jgi:hypothetical protein
MNAKAKYFNQASFLNISVCPLFDELLEQKEYHSLVFQDPIHV